MGRQITQFQSFNYSLYIINLVPLLGVLPSISNQKTVNIHLKPAPVLNWYVVLLPADPYCEVAQNLYYENQKETSEGLKESMETDNASWSDTINMVVIASARVFTQAAIDPSEWTDAWGTEPALTLSDTQNYFNIHDLKTRQDITNSSFISSMMCVISEGSNQITSKILWCKTWCK